LARPQRDALSTHKGGDPADPAVHKQNATGAFDGYGLQEQRVRSMHQEQFAMFQSPFANIPAPRALLGPGCDLADP
jgi:hypothetical protein